MGGAETQLLKIIKHLKNTDKKITIIARKTDDDKRLEEVSENITIYRINTTNIRFISMIIFCIATFFLIYKINRVNKFDIIHLPLPDIYIIMIFILRRILKIPITSMVAGDEVNPQGYIGLWYIDRKIVKNLILKSDGIQTLNTQTFEFCEKIVKDKEKIYLVPMGVEIPLIKRDYKNFSNNIVYIGAMRFFPEKQEREIKNLNFLIDSFSELIKIKPELKLYMVGDGNYRSNLEKRVEELKLQDQVIFTGYQTNVQKYLEIADIFVNPSLSEGMPNTVIEAMASNVFVLCSDIHPHRYIIRNNVSGVLFNNTSRSDFIEKVLSFYNNRKRSSEIAKAGNVYAINHFSMNAIVNQNLEMYKKSRYQYLSNLQKC